MLERDTREVAQVRKVSRTPRPPVRALPTKQTLALALEAGTATEFAYGGLRFLLVPVDGAGSQTEVPDTARPVGEIPIGGRMHRVFRLDAGVVSRTDGDPARVLTRREFDIVRQVCLGEPSKRIAWRLGISEYTVKTYLKQIFIKLDVHSRSAMVYRCARWVGGEIDIAAGEAEPAAPGPRRR